MLGWAGLGWETIGGKDDWVVDAEEDYGDDDRARGAPAAVAQVCCEGGHNALGAVCYCLMEDSLVAQRSREWLQVE